MSKYKCSMLFNVVTNTPGSSVGQHVGGWSEQWYADYPKPGLVPAFQQLCQLRAIFLTPGTVIVGTRYQVIEPTGGGFVVLKDFVAPGSIAGVKADIPQMAVQCRLNASGRPNVRNWLVRGINDELVKFGELVSKGPVFQWWALFIAALQRNGFQYRGRNLQALQTKILSVSSGGLMTLNAAPGSGFAVGDEIQVLRTIDHCGRKRGGFYTIAAPVTSTSFTLIGWQWGDTVKGTARAAATVYNTPADPTLNDIIRVTTRKVGRPFFQYRGKRSIRR